MKKIITSLATAAILSTGAFASGSVQIGGSSNDIGNSNTTNGGFYLGFDRVSVGSNGLLFGADFNVNIFRVSNFSLSQLYFGLLSTIREDVV